MYMEIILILLIVGGLAFAAWNGYRKGLILIVLSMFALLASVTVTMILMIPVSAIVKSSTNVYGFIEDNVQKIVIEDEITQLADIDRLNLPENIKNTIDGKVDEAAGNLAGQIRKTVTDAIFNAALFFVLFMIIYIITMILIRAVNLVGKLPVINEVNKFAGLLAGAAHGIIILYIACTILQMCAGMTWSKDVFEAINRNGFLSFIYNHNILSAILTRF